MRSMNNKDCLVCINNR